MIRLRFVARSGVGDALILWSENALRWRLGFTHVGALRVVDGVEYEVGARDAVDGALDEKPGFAYRRAEYATFRRKAIVDVPATLEETRAFWAKADELVGTPYSARVIAGFFLGRGSRDHLGVICSQAMGLCLSAARMLPPELAGSEDRLDPEAMYYLALGMKGGSSCH